MKILITGAGGQLGQALVRDFAAVHEVDACDRVALDLTDRPAVRARILSARPDLIVNCAAYNRVDEAEEQAVHAFAVNALAVRTLARAAADAGAGLVHYSSDFVFDGRASEPYREDAAPNPQSVYAMSKLVGEWLARDAPRWYVLRVESLFGGPQPRSSLDRLIGTLAAGGEAPVFADRVASPSFVVDVAAATRTILEREAPPGLYHCVNSGHATWQEIGEEILRLLGASGRLRPIRLEDLRLKAPRPRYCALSNGRLASLGIVMPTWQDALARHLRAR